MEKFILGEKLGMTQIFGDKGVVVPVTAILCGPCVVTQIKTEGTDGYNSVQIGFSDIRKKLVNKPEMGAFKKAKVTPKRYLREFRIESNSNAEGAEIFTLGQELNCDVFAEGDVVDVTSRTKGHGYTGNIKRWNQHRQPMTHGTSVSHRPTGSLGANSTPSRVFKNRRMSGQYGNEQVTIQNLTIVKVDKEKNCLLVKGGVPGPEGSLIVIKTAVKKNVGGAK